MNKRCRVEEPDWLKEIKNEAEKFYERPVNEWLKDVIREKEKTCYICKKPFSSDEPLYHATIEHQTEGRMFVTLCKKCAYSYCDEVIE